MTPLYDFIRQNGAALAVSAGEHLFRQGEDCDRLFLVQSGLLKAYYLRPDGREHVKSFVPAGAVIGSMVAASGEGAATFSLIALEAATLIALPYARVEAAALGDLALANGVIAFLSAYARRKEAREYELLCLPAEARYRRAFESLGPLAARISQADLAAYIGITPPALSRLKKRIGPAAD